jgi:hypothetical protein
MPFRCNLKADPAEVTRADDPRNLSLRILLTLQPFKSRNAVLRICYGISISSKIIVEKEKNPLCLLGIVLSIAYFSK